MLHREITSSRSTSIIRSTMTIPVPVEKKSSNLPENYNYEKYSQSGEVPFFPSSSPPVSDFIRRLEKRSMVYNK